MNLECRKVQALMSLYIDDALSYDLRMFVYNHLQKCKPCMEKYLALKKTMNYVKSVCNKMADRISGKDVFDVYEYNTFKENLPAFLDDELDTKLKTKCQRYIDNNHYAYQMYNDALNTNDAIKKFFSHASSNVNIDLSDKVICLLKKDKKIRYFDKAKFILFVILGFTIVLCFYFLEFALIPIKQKSNINHFSLSKIQENIIKGNFRDFLY